MIELLAAPEPGRVCHKMRCDAATYGESRAFQSRHILSLWYNGNA